MFPGTNYTPSSQTCAVWCNVSVEMIYIWIKYIQSFFSVNRRCFGPLCRNPALLPCITPLPALCLSPLSSAVGNQWSSSLSSLSSSMSILDAPQLCGLGACLCDCRLVTPSQVQQIPHALEFWNMQHCAIGNFGTSRKCQNLNSGMSLDLICQSWSWNVGFRPPGFGPLALGWQFWATGHSTCMELPVLGHWLWPSEFGPPALAWRVWATGFD